MPSTFNENFDPFRGDIIYGTTGDRASYLEDFLESEELERLQLTSGKTFSITSRGFYVNDYNDPLTYTDYSDLDDLDIRTRQPGVFNPITPEFHQQQRNYIQDLIDSRYSPNRLIRSSWRDLAKGDRRLLTQLKETPQDQMRAAAMVLAIRRACKFGIEYVLRLPSNAYVHYILDEIDMVEVVRKEERPLWTGTTGVPITTTELRFLFREWYRLRGKNILFYRNRVTTQPPWETDPEAWLGYARRRAQKYSEQLSRTHPNTLQQFNGAAIMGNAPLALTHFHAMPAIASIED